MHFQTISQYFDIKMLTIFIILSVYLKYIFDNLQKETKFDFEFVLINFMKAGMGRWFSQ